MPYPQRRDVPQFPGEIGPVTQGDQKHNNPVVHHLSVFRTRARMLDGSRVEAKAQLTPGCKQLRRLGKPVRRRHGTLAPHGPAASLLRRPQEMAGRLRLAALRDRCAAPLARIDIAHRLGQHPLVAERIDQAGLSLPIRHITSSLIGISAGRSGSREHFVDILDSEHDLMGRAGNALVVSELAHYYFGALAVDPELHAVGLADTDMLDQPENCYVPGSRLPHVGHPEDWDHPRPRC